MIKIKKRVGPRIVLRNTSNDRIIVGKLAIKNNFDFPIGRKDSIKLKATPEAPYDLSLWSSPACQTLSKALEISRAMALDSPQASNDR